jgi:hypothetical protein
LQEVFVAVWKSRHTFSLGKGQVYHLAAPHHRKQVFQQTEQATAGISFSRRESGEGFSAGEQ